MGEQATGKANRLGAEKSPYLLQHAHNPVDWYPWGSEAFEKARREDKPLLLSIGYSTCHWCHVMEHESFSQPTVAEVMNRHFVCVKLDREERPDVDKIYMSAVQAMTGQGGWPLNVFLTPELKPFFGGTYFPPQARWGQPGFVSLLERINELWTSRRQELESDAARLTESLKRYAAGQASQAERLDEGWLKRGFEGLRASFDPQEGGFGGAPKFPMPANHHFLLRYHARTHDPEALRLVTATLTAMAAGGIFDQVGGGFHRYSTDAAWRVPHFEKMLYDNAQLASVYLEAAQAAPGEPGLKETARRTLDYVLRDLGLPEGGFASAEDADSEPPEGGKKAEGAFYLWTEAELKEALGQDAGPFLSRYGVEKDGNAPVDPHGEFTGQNILYAARPLGDLSLDERQRSLLLERRARRPRPGLDDKVLTSWNGLMLSALSRGFEVLGEARYLDAALKAAAFLRANLYDPASKTLSHRWRAGEKAVDGFSDDYAFLAQGLLDLYESSGEAAWLEWAIELTREQQRRFASPEGGLFMTSQGHDEALLMRVMEDTDNVEPCASSVAALNLLRLCELTDGSDWRDLAEKTLRRFGPKLEQRPLSLPQMLSAAAFALGKPSEIVVAGDWRSERGRSLLQIIRARFLPFKTLLLLDEDARPKLEGLQPFLTALKPLNGHPTVYICRDRVCAQPTTDAGVLAGLLERP